MNQFCSPANEDLTHTCFTNDSLIKIGNAYNDDMNQPIINIPKNKKLDDSSRKKLWNNIKKAMIDVSCKEDHCLLNHSIVSKMKDDNINHHTFRPIMPESWNDNMNTWLSTIDILKVMKQYEKKHPDFIFIGPVPIDFNYRISFGMCISNELCNFNLEKFINSGKKRLGVVFNLDPHYMSGSHWVAMFFDANTGGIYFFDSYGIKPKKEILQFMEIIKKQGNKLLLENKIQLNNLIDEHKNYLRFELLNEYAIRLISTEDIYVDDLLYFSNRVDEDIPEHSINIVKNVNGNIVEFRNKIDCGTCRYVIHKCFKIFYNKNKFQHENSECGVYSMHFIEEFLNGKKYQEIVSNTIHDKRINLKRKHYYRPNSS